MTANYIDDRKTFKNSSNNQMLSDREIVCNGKLVSSDFTPDRYFNGWYPVRKCSYSHPNPTAAGIRSTKESSFQNYKVICTVCDTPGTDHGQGGPSSRLGMNEDRQLPYCSSRSSLVPIQCSSTRKVADMYWRHHDPHNWTSVPLISDGNHLHKSNWFANQINLEILDNQRKKQWDRFTRSKKSSNRLIKDFRSMPCFAKPEVEKHKSPFAVLKEIEKKTEAISADQVKTEVTRSLEKMEEARKRSSNAQTAAS